MAEYRLTDPDAPSAGCIIRTTDGAALTPDEDNADWQRFKAWLEAGGVPDPFIADDPDVPEAISDRQFFQQLAIEGTISQAEALTAVKTGDLPNNMKAFLASLPASQRFSVEMVLCGATTFYRSHPMTNMIGAAFGRSPAQMDDFFSAAALL